MPEISKFEYPFDNAMFDPVRRLRVSLHTGMHHYEALRFDPGSPVPISAWIYHDPAIETGRYSMPLQPEPFMLTYEWYRKSFRPGQMVPLSSKRSNRISDVPCTMHECGESIRLKVHGKGFAFRCYHMRGSIESLRIPLVSNDISSMYIDVFKAFPGLRSLRKPGLFPAGLFEQASIIEMCVTTGALTEGLGRLASHYPEVEEGWHCLSTWSWERETA